jgi:hypothetical protein
METCEWRGANCQRCRGTVRELGSTRETIGASITFVSMITASIFLSLHRARNCQVNIA